MKGLVQLFVFIPEMNVKAIDPELTSPQMVLIFQLDWRKTESEVWEQFRRLQRDRDQLEVNDASSRDLCRVSGILNLLLDFLLQGKLDEN